MNCAELGSCWSEILAKALMNADFGAGVANMLYGSDGDLCNIRHPSSLDLLASDDHVRFSFTEHAGSGDVRHDSLTLRRFKIAWFGRRYLL